MSIDDPQPDTVDASAEHSTAPAAVTTSPSAEENDNEDEAGASSAVPGAGATTTAGEESDSDSDSDDSSSSSKPVQQVEWLVTTRERRSTAGNRLKSLLAREAAESGIGALAGAAAGEGTGEGAEGDSDLELLFAEAEDDAVFELSDEDAAGAADDEQMDSSSDEDEGKDGGEDDELAGEKELERERREARKAEQLRKRKARDALPKMFRKKVRINTRGLALRKPGDSEGDQAAAGASAGTTAGEGSDATTVTMVPGTRRPVPQPQPRPKRKSERTSWLPTDFEQPTRASERKTTRLSKEQLHAQMVEREFRRMKQLEAQAKRESKRLKDGKGDGSHREKRPMTQAERLAEAAIVEKRNAKSLNRWEETERLREEERLARLVALQNRKLSGPVVTFWSGVEEWKGGVGGTSAGAAAAAAGQLGDGEASRALEAGGAAMPTGPKMVQMEEKAPRRKRGELQALKALKRAVKAEAKARKARGEPALPLDELTRIVKEQMEKEAGGGVAAEEGGGDADVEMQDADGNVDVMTTEDAGSGEPAAATINSTAQPEASKDSTTQLEAAEKSITQSEAAKEPTTQSEAAKELNIQPEAEGKPTTQSEAAERPAAQPEVKEDPTAMASTVKDDSAAQQSLRTDASEQPHAPTEPDVEGATPKDAPASVPESGSMPVAEAVTSPQSVTAPPVPVNAPVVAPVTAPAENVAPAPGSQLPLQAAPFPPIVDGPAKTDLSSPAAKTGPTVPSGLRAPQSSLVPSGTSSSVLAAPVGATSYMMGGSVPMLGMTAGPAQQTKANVLALPNAAHSPSPLSLPPLTPDNGAPGLSAPQPAAAAPQPLVGPAQAVTQPSTAEVPAAQSPAAETPAVQAPAVQTPAVQTPTVKTPDETPATPAANQQHGQQLPPSDGKYTRNVIILQNFNKTAIQDKNVQTQILFGKTMRKLGKPPPQPLCVITNQPARYRDPKTGLPYYNAAAYRELQRVARGEYRWSEPLAAYVGDPTARAAKGVPARFLDPKAKRETFPPPPVNAKEETADKADEKASVGTGPLDKEGLPVQQKANDDPDGQAALPQSAQQPQVPARPTEGLAQ